MPLPALIPILISAGAPILASIIESKVKGKGGKIAGTVLREVADAVGANEATPEAIEATVEAMPADTLRERLATLEAQYRAAQALSADLTKQMLAEVSSDDPATRLWRPLNGIAFALEILAVTITFCIVVLRGETSMVSVLGAGYGVLAPILATHAGVVGLYVHRRSAEKVSRAD